MARPIGPLRSFTRPPSRTTIGGAALELAEHGAQVVEHQRRERRPARHHRERPARRAGGEHGAPGHLRLDLLGRLVERRGVHGLEQLTREVGHLLGPRAVEIGATGERAGGVEQHGGASVRVQLAEPLWSALRSGRKLGASHRGQNTGVPLSRISWLVTVGICLIAALLLLLNGYYGYSGVLFAVGLAAAVNLL